MANENKIKTRVQMKADTAENWSKAEGFTPLTREPIFYTDTGEIKLGDGENNVNDLPQFNVGKKTADGGIVFNEDSSAISLNTVAQGNGVVAGSKAFHILELVNEDSYKLDDVTGIEVEDVYSLKLDNNYLSRGKVTNIDVANRIVTVTNRPSEGLATDEVTGEVLQADTLANSFRIDSKPTIGTKDFGVGAYAEGRDTLASGDGSHAEGHGTIALGRYAHAEGNQTAAYHGAHSEGEYSTASGNTSHSEGHTTTASGFAAHAEGNQTEASGNISHAEGYKTKAINSQAHSEGQSTIAEGIASHAEGYNTRAKGIYSHSEGYQTVALGAEAHAEGRSEELTDKTTSAEIETAWFNGTTPKNFSAAVGIASHVEGTNNVVLSNYGHAEGLKNIVKSNGSQAHVEGYDNEVSDGGAHVEGLRNTSCGDWSHVQGKYNAPGNFAHVVGGGTGTAASQRKNVHTIDWSGNAVFSGDVYVKATDKSCSKEYAKKLATVEELQNKLDANGWVIAEDGEISYDSAGQSGIHIRPYAVHGFDTMNDKEFMLSYDTLEVYDYHGYLHNGKFTSTGIVSTQGPNSDGTDSVTVTANFPTQSGTLAVTKDVTDAIDALDLDNKLANKLDANGWTNTNGTLRKEDPNNSNTYAYITHDGLHAQMSAGGLTYGCWGITGTVDAHSGERFSITYDGISIDKIDENYNKNYYTYNYPNNSGTLLVDKDIEALQNRVTALETAFNSITIGGSY